MKSSRRRSPSLRVNDLEPRCLTAAVSSAPAVISQLSAQAQSLCGRVSGQYRFESNRIRLQGLAQVDGIGTMRLSGQLDFGDRGPTQGWISLSNPRGSIVLLLENLTPIEQGEGGIVGAFKIVKATGGYSDMHGGGQIWLAGEARGDSGGVFIGQLGAIQPV